MRCSYCDDEKDLIVNCMSCVLKRLNEYTDIAEKQRTKEIIEILNNQSYRELFIECDVICKRVVAVIEKKYLEV